MSILLYLLCKRKPYPRIDAHETMALGCCAICSPLMKQRKNNGNINNYWDGVASFRTFQQAYRSAFQDTNRSNNYLICDEVYGYFIGEVEKSQTHITDIIEVMEPLSKDIEDLNGHDQMLNLRNILSYEE